MTEMTARMVLAIGVIVVLWVLAMVLGFNRAIGNLDSSISHEFITNFEIFVLAITGVFAIVFIVSIVRDVDFSREKEMRLQIELEKQRARKPDDDEQREWIMK